MLKRDARVPSRVLALTRQPLPSPPLIIFITIIIIIILVNRERVQAYCNRKERGEIRIGKARNHPPPTSYIYIYIIYRIKIFFPIPRNFDRNLESESPKGGYSRHTRARARKARTRYTWLHEVVAKTSLYGVASFTSRSTIIILLGKISPSPSRKRRRWVERGANGRFPVAIGNSNKSLIASIYPFAPVTYGVASMR